MNYSSHVNKLNPPDANMDKTDYWKFFDEHGFIDNTIDAITTYLNHRFGFIKGTDKIDHECLQNLHTINDYYFVINVRKKRFEEYDK